MLDRLVRKHVTTQQHVGGCLFSRENKPGAALVKIGWDKYLPFWKDYCEALDENPHAFESSQLYECNKDETSLRFTFSFKFVKSTSSICDNDIENIIPVIRETIFKTLQLDSNEAIACVSSTSGGNSLILDYQFPAIRVDKDYFNKTIQPYFCDRLRSAGVKKNLPEFKGDWEAIILPLTVYSPVYGCRFSKDEERLKFIGMWSSTEFKLEEDLTESFTAKKHALFQSNCSREIETIDEDTTDYTPVIFSSLYSRATTLPKINEQSSKFSYVTEVSSSSEMDMIYHLLPILGTHRFENDMFRWQVGRCIFNIFQRDQSGLDLLNTYSPSFKEANLENWEDSYPNDTGVNDYLSIRTIGYFAKIDNPDEYQLWHASWMNEAIVKSFDMVELNIAEVMYRLLWLDFTTVGMNTWYRFSSYGTKLVKSIANVEFKKRFNDVIHFYSKVLTESTMNLSSISMVDAPDSKLRDSTIDKNKIIGTIMKYLGKGSNQNAIEKLCFIKFYREGVDKFFDTNPALMGWNNCISEVYNKKVFVRPGKMEDFVTMNSDISYDENEYTWDHPKITEVLYWFETAFVDPDLVDCFLKICSSFLYGRNVEKSVYAFCGPTGDNSKSMVQLMLERLFAVYCINFPVSVLTDARQSGGGPSPELAQAKGARIANVAEPDGKIPFMGSLIKRYSGGDTFFARGNHQDGGAIEAMFKMILYCNAVPPIDGADEAVEKRLKIIPFLSKYCNNAPKDIDEQFAKRRFPMDPLFEKKINLFRRPMLWIVINYYEKYSSEGIVPPQIVVDYTKQYWEDNDPYKLFKNENLVETNSDGDKISITNCYKIFKVWYSANFNTKKTGVPELSTMVRHLSAGNLLGEPKNRIWNGWRIQLPAQNDDTTRKHDID